MTPTAFTPGSEVARRARLSEMPGCWLEAKCGQCGNTTNIPMRLLVGTYGADWQIGAIIERLVCKRCRVKPKGVWLNETHNRMHNFGGAPGWSVQLIGAPDTVSAVETAQAEARIPL